MILLEGDFQARGDLQLWPRIHEEMEFPSPLGSLPGKMDEGFRGRIILLEETFDWKKTGGVRILTFSLPKR